ncbi:MAG: hypothetical protein KAU35_03590 [candidate division Zixibacteria bacterium]|nr:hypothetical protein [candidate division Zixibacteria bacterium]
MTTLNKQFRRYTQQYMREHNVDAITLDEVADWIIRQGYWEPESSALRKLCKEKVRSALREQCFTDAQGRKVRGFHPVIREENGKQTSLWYPLLTASRDNMALSFQQRRKGIVGDCRKLKTDVDSFNDNNNEGEPIQLILDFTNDVLELELELAGATRKTFATELKPPSRQFDDVVQQSASSPAPSHP